MTASPLSGIGIGMPSRFMLVGLACAATHNAILLVADLWHIHYALGCVLSFLVVVVMGFALHARFTFQVPATPAGFGRYAISMAANYPLTLALLFAMCDIAGLPVTIAAPSATVLMFAWNFAASRWAIGRPRPAPPLAPSSRQP